MNERQGRLPELSNVLIAISLTLGLLLRSPAFIVFVCGGALLAYFPNLYAIWGRKALHYRASFSQAFAWPGENVRLTLELENRSFTPISLLHVWHDISSHVHVVGVEHARSSVKRQLHHAFRLGMWQRVRRRYTVECERRGVVRVGPTEIIVTGPFGYGSAHNNCSNEVQLIVYPRVHALEELRVLPCTLLGPSTLKSFIHEDPLRIRGVREYVPGDPLNRINWKATARAARHMVHVHEPSANVEVMFLLNLANSDEVWFRQDASETEWSIEVTASLGVALLDSACSVGVSANDYITDLPIGAGPLHMHSLLATLACTTPYAMSRPSTFLANALEQRRFGTTLVLVSPILTEEMLSAVALGSQRYAPFHIVYTGSTPSVLFDDTSMLWIRREGSDYVR